jgi:hypothetical protein
MVYGGQFPAVTLVRFISLHKPKTLLGGVNLFEAGLIFTYEQDRVACSRGRRVEFFQGSSVSTPKAAGIGLLDFTAIATCQADTSLFLNVFVVAPVLLVFTIGLVVYARSAVSQGSRQSPAGKLQDASEPLARPGCVAAERNSTAETEAKGAHPVPR